MEEGRELGYFCINPTGRRVRVLPSPSLGVIIPQPIWPVESVGRAGSGGQRKPQTERVRHGSGKLGQRAMNRREPRGPSEGANNAFLSAHLSTS